MIAATLDTSTRSTPTPMALTRSEPQAPGEPGGRGYVPAHHQPQPRERDPARGPQREQGPQRGAASHEGIQLLGPAAPLSAPRGLEGEPPGVQPPRRGAQRVLPF